MKSQAEMIYKVEGSLKPGTQDKVLDDLIAAYDAVDEICTCGTDPEKILGFVEPQMLSMVTRIILRYADDVHVTVHVDEDELVKA